MKCYASDYCQKDKSSCSDVCGGYRVLRALYNLSRIPERYRYTIALKPENGEDLEAFYAEYGTIFRDGYYENGERGIADWCGINYYPPEQTMRIVELLKKENPRDAQVLLDWLADADKYNGLYLLGL